MSKRVVIVGGGFAGLQAAKKLGNQKDFEITLIDRRNYHLFQPLLYQVAMAGLSPAEIATPIRSVLSTYKNVKVLLGNVERVELDRKEIHTSTDSFSYDYLILACGAKHSYFGNERWEKFAPGLKTLEQATEIRRRVLTAFELAEREKDSEKRKQYLTFVVVGGGPTGVELAGAIGEITRFTLARDFRNIQVNHSRVILVEGGPRILPAFDPDLSKSATRSLEKLGVQVWTNSFVTEIHENGVEIGEESIKSGTVLWASGVQPSSLNPTLGIPIDERKRVIVGPDLSIKGHPEVFVIGDQANAKGSDGEPLPGLAPVAIQQGTFVGKLLIDEQKGKPRKQFSYFDKGQLATIGRKMAVMQMGKTKASGLVAWLAWLFVHIYYLIGFKNRLFVFFQWIWHYFSYRRGARLIVQKEWRSYEPES